ncbi:hypothetical protein GCM10007086_04760 [Photobacterium aphoticum]|nr:hypothetical protein GCM10007086_04760 [Photobacterium aphoticum]
MDGNSLAKSAINGAGILMLMLLISLKNNINNTTISTWFYSNKLSMDSYEL